MERALADIPAAHALFAALADEPVEVAAFVYLSADRRLLGMRHARSGLPDTVWLPIRAVAIDALALGATALLVAHNHPGGDPTPTRADVDGTRTLARALDSLEIVLLDHLVIARGGIASFRALGLL
jgi:DNA repair protein RadC